MRKSLFLFFLVTLGFVLQEEKENMKFLLVFIKVIALTPKQKKTNY